MPRRCWFRAAALGPATAALLSGCATVGNLTQVTQLPAGQYTVWATDDPSLRAAVPWRELNQVYQLGDTLRLDHQTAPDSAPTQRFYQLPLRRYVTLQARRFDVDVFTIPFKVRPARAGVPVQLNTNFNGALYFGRRLDFYRLSTYRGPGGRVVPAIRATGFGYGGFVGLGSTFITGDVTRQTPGPEYEGFVMHAGAAGIFDARVFNVGLAVGVDHLLGPDGQRWIYQHRPWFGILFGLDLN
ncbi:hypothetical protein [Hymenobacter edaphi]|uniref:Outer membrane protein beta-barrel domain-containing protein n=1 Tax=Hymenobacter edaphi TaxID=2211146 RepID=A0A328BAG4_9BACT|nr:hypothetical protein [Hymenobacter edaphi]RAK63987.1 hypothetical protein DLM85_18735 [Hymenobacter edaphi]